MTTPTDKRESRWFTALRGLRIEKHKAATRRWVKRRLARARRRGASAELRT
jgi:hypothetical protein